MVICQALPLWAGGRQLSGTGWNKYPLTKCSEGLAPRNLPAAHWPQIHSLRVFDSLPGPLVNTLL